MSRSTRFIAIALAALVAAGLLTGAMVPAHAGTHQGIQGPIYFRQPGPAGIQRINPDGSGLQTIVPQTLRSDLHTPEDPAISPDGKKLVFSATDEFYGAHPVLLQMDVDPPGPWRRLRTADADNEDIGEMPTWSPDGRSVVFSRHRRDGSDTADLYLIGPGITEALQLTVSPPGYYAEDPEWSPNGRWVSFSLMKRSFGAGGSDIRIVEPVIGGEQRVLQTFSSDITTPTTSWRPDSARLVFDIPGSGLFAVTFDANGNPTGRQRVFGSTSSDRYPVYAPSNSPGTTGDTIVTTRGISEFWFISSSANAGSQRGPIPGGRGTTWARFNPVPQRPTQNVPVRATVQRVSQEVLDALRPECPPNVACSPPSLDRVVETVIKVPGPVTEQIIVGSPPAIPPTTIPRPPK